MKGAGIEVGRKTYKFKVTYYDYESSPGHSVLLVKKLIKKKSDLKESKILNYKVNKNNLFYSKLKLIIGNEVTNK